MKKLVVTILAMAILLAVASTSFAAEWSNFPLTQRTSYNASYARAVQNVIKYNFQNLTVDGVFGTGTESAVLGFQTSNGLYLRDGKVGQQTWNQLFGKLSAPDYVSYYNYKYKVKLTTGGYSTTYFFSMDATDAGSREWWWCYVAAPGTTPGSSYRIN